MSKNELEPKTNRYGIPFHPQFETEAEDYNDLREHLRKCALEKGQVLTEAQLDEWTEFDWGRGHHPYCYRKDEEEKLEAERQAAERKRALPETSTVPQQVETTTGERQFHPRFETVAEDYNDLREHLRSSALREGRNLTEEELNEWTAYDWSRGNHPTTTGKMKN